MRLLDAGQRHPWHVGYLPALGLFRDMLGWVGIEPTPMRLGTLFSATGMALGIMFFFAALRRLGVPRARLGARAARSDATAVSTAPSGRLARPLGGAPNFLEWTDRVRLATTPK